MAERHDAIVVGSGATGGLAAAELTARGLRVALIEAGPEIPFAEEAPVWGPRGPAPRQPVQSRCYAFNDRSAPLFVDDFDNPYSCPDDAPFDWIRSRQAGGRLHLWGRMTLRMSDLEFKAASRDGLGRDWPISYADLAPYYDRVERLLRVCGTAEGLAHLPDGDFLPPPPPSPGEIAFKRAVEGRWPERRVTSARIAQAPPGTMLEAARASGRLTMLADSAASRILLAEGGERARGVAYVDTGSGREGEVEAAAVVICASTIESTRLLLNSATAEHPDGLGNSSGALGRYLMDHTFGIGFEGFARQRSGGSDASSHGCLLPAFRNVVEEDSGFRRGYGVELQVHPPFASRRRRLGALGRPLPGRFWIRAFGEVLPRHENRVTIDPAATDAWGIPAVRIECRYSENETAMAVDQFAQLGEMVEAAGFEVEEGSSELAPPGRSIHELGTARMGDDPADSVLDPRNRCWDVPNLYLTDGACFTSGGFQNPTLTMMALTARACDHLAGALRGQAP